MRVVGVLGFFLFLIVQCSSLFADEKSECLALLNQIEARASFETIEAKRAFESWLKINRAHWEGEDAYLTDEEREFFRWAEDVLLREETQRWRRLRKTLRWLGRFGPDGESYAGLRRHLLAWVKQLRSQEKITYEEKEAFAAYFVQALPSLARWLKLTPLYAMSGPDETLVKAQKHKRGAAIPKVSKYSQTPFHLTYATNQPLDFLEFNELRPYPIYFLGVRETYGRADGQIESPEGFYDHDLIHTRGMMRKDLNPYKIPGTPSPQLTWEQKYRWILERQQLQNDLTTFIHSQPDAAQKILVPIIFYAFHEAYVNVTRDDLKAYLSNNKSSVAKEVKALTGSSQQEVLPYLDLLIRHLGQSG